MTEFVEGQQPADDDAQIGAEEGAQAPVEGGQQTQEAADPFEDVAREHGWTPKEEWRGKPDDWRGPREFVAYGMKRSRESAEEMKSMRSELKSIGRVAETIQRRAVDDARREIEARFADAVEQKDHEGARAAREELTRIDREASAPAHDEVQSFMSRNTWFNQNRGATLIAQGVTAQLAQQGVGVSEQLRAAEEAVRAEMPHLFGQAQQPAKQPARVSAPQTRAAQPSARAKGFADLPVNAQAAGRDFVKRGMVKTLEDYAKVYHEENA